MNMSRMRSFVSFLHSFQLNTELVKVKLEVENLEQMLDKIRNNLDRKRKVRRTPDESIY